MSYLSTKTGDAGTTKMGSQRLSKSHDDIAIMSLLDCAQSQIGLLYTAAPHCDPVVEKFITRTVNDIYTIMGQYHLRYDDGSLAPEHIKPFIDNLDEFLRSIPVPKVNKFIRPNSDNCIVNNVRANIRLYEQRLYSLEREPLLSVYLNRLSDCCHAISLHLDVYNAPLIEPRNPNTIRQAIFIMAVVLAIACFLEHML